ncbi:Gfo/Idh/MocA family oxidoreductase [Paenibacillus hemerocallicola]|uniref:Gfo/Idh/MocA family oxidoreductase n=1 Tax=Paenibacillus hemerocallicola TaxID=1172614 RepID=A0A5C4SZY7_9BACL|nr:Gfo/Idh/MocA family oxidoreductase [Paenibacillus hemerocallicola]TNJ60654.1 Gfo/Idh/MocA family oxidoreductase [Paenibacillus hemerocallicola]
MRTRIAIIGLGDIAEKAYLPVVAHHPGVEIVALMSRSEETVERIGEAYRVPGRTTKLNELLERELDAVFVHSPTETHADIVLACLDRGLHVYVDKPLSYKLEESERMAEQAEKRGKLLAVGFNRRFAPMYTEAKRWLEETGGFDLCIAQKHRTRQQTLPAKETLYDDMIHMIDLLLWLGAKPGEVTSWISEKDADGRLLHASGSLRTGTSASFVSMNRRAGGDLEKLELHGGGRSAEIVNLDSAVLRDKREGEHTKRFGSWETVSHRRGFAGIVDHFLATLDRPMECLVSADKVLETHRLVEKLSGM